MLISEIFHSLQGEGVSVGEPVTFVRFSGCNLSCPGCDTKYHKDGIEMTVDEVVSKIKELDKGSKVVVFSGGEPFMQQEAVVDIFKKLKPFAGKGQGWVDWSFQIETNGTIYPDKILNYLHDSDNKYTYVRFNISPKLPSFNTESDNSEGLKNLHLWGTYIIKPVITSEEDIVVLQSMQKKFNWKNADIYLMPYGATKEEQEKSMPVVAALALKYNYHMTPRLHTLIWGNRKGV